MAMIDSPYAVALSSLWFSAKSDAIAAVTSG
jgi:hypothetical protein